jgi:hypothetical protein
MASGLSGDELRRRLVHIRWIGCGTGAGVIRDDVELAEVYALLVGVSRAAAHDHLGEAGTARVLTVVFDGLAPRR